MHSDSRAVEAISSVKVLVNGPREQLFALAKDILLTVEAARGKMGIGESVIPG